MKKNEKDLLKFSERRNAIINALNSALDIFTTHSDKDFENVISSGLKLIADAVGLDRIVFYRYRFIFCDVYIRRSLRCKLFLLFYILSGICS